jgi:hypothetical protein
VIIESEADIQPGDFVAVNIVNADEHDLYAEVDSADP